MNMSFDVLIRCCCATQSPAGLALQRLRWGGGLRRVGVQDEIQRIAMSKISDSTITAAWRAQRKATKEREAAVKAVAASFPPALVIAPQASDPAQS